MRETRELWYYLVYFNRSTMNLPVFNNFITTLRKWKIFGSSSHVTLLATEALKNAKNEDFEKSIRRLQKNGLLFPINKETCLEIFLKTQGQMHALGCEYVFNFHIFNKEEQKLELLVFSADGTLAAYEITDHVNAEVLLQKHAPLGIPLSQLQDIAGWLHNHGAVAGPLLNREAIEKKLEGLIKSCPHGAYVLHTHNKALTLSRLCPRGRIEHLIINLQKQLGGYIIEQEGTQIAATRTQFKRRLEQMGTPVRFRSS